MYVCLGCYNQLESQIVEDYVPCYDAPFGGSVDSFDVVTSKISPLMDGLCVTCYFKANPVLPNVDSLDDDDLPF